MANLLPPRSARYANLGVTTLARLTHEAEEAEDDITFLAVQDAIESRAPAEREAYRLEYIRLMKEYFAPRRAALRAEEGES